MSSPWMFPALIAVILTGFPVTLTMMALAVAFGLHSFGLIGLQYQFIQKIEEVATAQVLAAVPLFIFMGAMFEASGIASRLFDAIHMWTRRVPGGLAVGTVMLAVVIGPVANASVGNILLGMFIPGFMLAGAYIVYIVLLCSIR
jgi:TRAP-type mannitol/chloroaromatic compound transport system permease large subunit